MKTIASLRITPLVENCTNRPGVLAEHGLAFWIEADSHRILFDTGQTPRVIEYNARALGIDMAAMDALVLSHGHYDHTGGLSAACKAAAPERIVLHPAALEPKYTRDQDGTFRATGISTRHKKLLHDHPDRLLPSTEPTELFPGLFVSGQIPRRTSFETGDGRFFLDARGEHPDPLLDDQALFAVTDAGVVVVLGCAHAGVINTLNHIRSLAGETNLLAVIGGLHLDRASHKHMEVTAAALLRHGAHRLAPCHCTGFEATAFLWARMRGQCVACHVGDSLAF